MSSFSFFFYQNLVSLEYPISDVFIARRGHGIEVLLDTSPYEDDDADGNRHVARVVTWMSHDSAVREPLTACTDRSNGHATYPEDQGSSNCCA